MLNDVNFKPEALAELGKIYAFDASGKKRKREEIESLQWNHGISKSFACEYNFRDDAFEFPRSKVHWLLLNGTVLALQVKGYINDTIDDGSSRLKQAYRRYKEGKSYWLHLILLTVLFMLMICSNKIKCIH